MKAEQTEDVYENVYRRLNPPSNPFCPYERRRHLRDLWPSEQAKFKALVDASLAALAGDDPG